MTIVLGGGISGLSAAYYAANDARNSAVILLEASSRVGGWIRSIKSPTGAIFEQGPRTVRPVGLAGRNTLNLVEDLQLSNKIIPIGSSHPATRNRLIYADETLHLLPVSLKGIFKTISLLDRPLINCLWTDLRAPRISKEDESIFKSNHVELLINGNIQECSRVISSLPAKNLAELVREQHPTLSAELEAIPTVTVGVVNFEFQGDVLPLQAFGFLVPPKENLPLLGVIFDSCVFPQKSSTVLTVMMGGAWFEKYFGANPSEDYLLTTAIDHTKDILRIEEEPVAHNVAVLKDCIPQHVVGHTQRVKRIHEYISAHHIPLGLCGSSYQGVGLNDVILRI